MNGIFDQTMETPMMTPENLHELVRGQEQNLLDKIEPLVREQSVTLDFRNVERIDAAGIAALISLYGNAHARGHEFTIVNASHRVAEILSLVGLDRILISHIAVPGLLSPVVARVRTTFLQQHLRASKAACMGLKWACDVGHRQVYTCGAICTCE